MVASAPTRLSMGRLAAVPAVISLAVTVVRLVGELGHWNVRFFTPGPGGSGGIVGITWLAPVFGVYFALKLGAAGERPRSALAAVGFALIGAAIIFFTGPIFRALVHGPVSFRGRLVGLWVIWGVAGLVTLPGWPRLWKTLLTYGYLARLPVVIIMFFAFRGQWGTHYDALPPDFTSASLWAKWIWLSFFAQFVFWIGYTLVSGMLFGSIAAAVTRLVRRPGNGDA